MTTMKLAVPTMGEAGLEAQRAGHFGHCDRFTIVTIEDGAVGLLAGEGVDAIVAAGMGGRPLAGFNQAGITVYFDNVHPVVGDAVAAVATGEAPIMDPSQACQHHH